MKKTLIKIMGLTAFAAIMFCNVSMFQSSSNGDTSLLNLGNIAQAQSETSTYTCPGGDPECVRIYVGSTTHIVSII